ncbi:Spo0E family sporulation regulatory protein-aspartic acid phosphatase [Cytobacillus gottheilii]|uniref:Spo0E family sporulation regulatory protein-aspartic acid phosphatase n=1 Tax=Cytobacillus gottheilii TaxID=859144 RepID=UPI0035A3980E
MSVLFVEGEIDMKGFPAVNKKELLALIEKKRTELIQVAMSSGLNSTDAIKYSQELDTLLNEYNRTFLKKA